MEDFAPDYDSDVEMQPPRPNDGLGADPYAGNFYCVYGPQQVAHRWKFSSGIFFSKDRREEVIEVEETPELVELEDGTLIPIMTQGEWMKGCPEGGEQGLLFQLYSQLSTAPCVCPSQCGYAVDRDKKTFFGITVRC